MQLLIMRHGEAEPARSSDAERVLTGQGRIRVRKTGSFLAEQLTQHVDLIYCSPLVRAVQTAEIMADRLGIDDALEINRALAGNDLKQLAASLVQCPPHVNCLLVVGHEPLLGQLIFALSQKAVRPSTGSVTSVDADIKRGAPGHGNVQWIVQGDPPQLKKG